MSVWQVPELSSFWDFALILAAVMSYKSKRGYFLRSGNQNILKDPVTDVNLISLTEVSKPFCILCNYVTI